MTEESDANFTTLKKVGALSKQLHSRESILANRIKKLERDTEKVNQRISNKQKSYLTQAKVKEEKQLRLAEKVRNEYGKIAENQNKRIHVL